MPRPVLPLCTLLLVSACSDPIEDARKAVSIELNQRGDEFHVLDATRYGDDVVCGQYRMIGKWGETGQERYFIYRDGKAEITNSAADVAVFCSDSPATALAKRFGITYTAQSRDTLDQVAQNMSSLSETLERYYKRHGAYPSTAQGLSALVEKPTARPVPGNYPEGGYLDALPQDPWQQPYRYEGPRWAGVKSPYRLWSEGADQAPGGEGDDADIDVTMLPYLEYVAKRLD